MWQICKINTKSERVSPDRFSQHCRDFYPHIYVYVLMVGYRSGDFIFIDHETEYYLLFHQIHITVWEEIVILTVVLKSEYTL